MYIHFENREIAFGMNRSPAVHARDGLRLHTRRRQQSPPAQLDFLRVASSACLSPVELSTRTYTYSPWSMSMHLRLSRWLRRAVHGRAGGIR